MSTHRPSTLTILLLLSVILAFCVPQIAAFGAGNIPSFAFLEGKAFRHGDIEDTLQELLKRGSGAGGGFAIGSLLSKGSKFGGLDIKRVYFGNWLRDYSQAVDIAGLKKLPLQTILNLCMVLGFLAHGYATNEFEVTEDRLGVYLPTEHIDNPKGYGVGEDPRKYHPKLRGPVDPRELEIDPRTGMKNYIANESGHWDTSKALVRRTLERCIHLGRQYRARGQKQDEYEAYRQLGQLLHTLEDFPAHSNFCELALVALGHHDVFMHVGDHVRIQSPRGKMVAPLVTGTFGGSDFMHSLLGEATDHISQASVSDLNKELSSARSKSSNGADSSSVLRGLLLKLPSGAGGEITREMEGVERIRAGPSGGGKRPEEMSPQEMHAVLWQVLSFRDSVVKKIEMTIEKIPGLGPLIEKLMDSIAVFVYTTLEPFLKPLLQTASNGLATSSAEVINTHDQYEVFNDPRASDPTHSFLSKDHFNLILNEPAGQLAKIIVAHTVKLVVKAWDDSSVNVHHLAEDVLSCLFHPEFHDSHSQVQREMMQYMQTWLGSHGHAQHDIIRRLSRDAVRNHRNIRAAGDNSGQSHVGGVGHDAGVQAQASLQGYLHNVPGVQQASSLMNTFGVGSQSGGRRDTAATSSSPGEGYRAQPSTYAAPPVPTGEASLFYGSASGHQGDAAQSFLPTEYGAQSSYHHHPASHEPPRHDAPSFPSASPLAFPAANPSFASDSTQYGGAHAPTFPSPDSGPGYTPSYAPPNGPPPTFPSGPSFPGGPPYGEQYPPPNQYNYGGGPPTGRGW
ncbi:heterokaryon incompatibility protein Het-C-domain-containing protein [Gautieria morchelliformis]|nr:heterokaryon incompatibility protein Het-C-domain-containing protein [Gautieria morchelliformis]